MALKPARGGFSDFLRSPTDSERQDRRTGTGRAGLGIRQLQGLSPVQHDFYSRRVHNKAEFGKFRYVVFFIINIV